MPKVGKISTNLSAEIQAYDLWYSPKEKFHIKGLPEHFLQTMYDEFQPWGYPSEGEIRTAFLIAVTNYKERIKTFRKVILFKIVGSHLLTMNKDPFNKEHGQSFSGMKRGISKRISTTNFGAEEAEVGISYQLAQEVNTGTLQYLPINEDGSLGFALRISVQTTDWQIIEWTPAREAFFESIYAGMEQLILRISEFFAGTDEVLLKKIDHAGGKFLLTDKA